MSQDSICRPWQVIAQELSAETNVKRIVALADELNRALQNKPSRTDANAHLSKTNLYLSSQPRDFQQIVESAVALMRSDYASVQMLHPERGAGGELRLLAFSGFNPEAARFWEWVRADSKSTCGLALLHKERVIAPDISGCDFMAGSEDRQTYLQTGIRACQTTPLIGHAGNVVGMISTHWRTPQSPSQKDLQLFDALAMKAANVIERCC